MKIIVDAFGGDNAPVEVLKACTMAQEELHVEIVLTGDEKKIKQTAQQENLNIEKFEIIHTEEVFDIHAQPQTIIKEGKNTSLALGLQALRDGKGDAFVSGGSTGGLVTGATFLTKRIKGVKRAALAPMLPTNQGRKMLLDAGANIECRPEMLVQFGIMGSAYMKCVKEIPNPKVALLNVGAEETKGRELELETYALLKKAPVNFCGNIEAREIPSGEIDVVVCDGFAGNVTLKLYEGMGAMFRDKLKKWFSGFTGKLAALLMLNDLKEFQEQMDYKSEGGAILLGIAYPVIKAHGSSDAKAFFNAIRQAKKCVDGNMIAEITNMLSVMKEGE
ncbi:MAG: phosphate acyltransferase PlsX [Oscillospiraceae bacterium]|nr:phosphate acyltransferase PlsX [Oscillospiraceae bacterium]